MPLSARLASVLAAASVALSALVGCDDWNWRGFLGRSQGALVAAPGMTLDDVQQASTLPLSSIYADPDGSRWATTKEVPLLFDFRLAGTGLVFSRCNYHVLKTGKGGDPVVRSIQLDLVSVGWTERKSSVADLQLQLQRDGWTPHGPAYMWSLSPDQRAMLDGLEATRWSRGGLQLDFFVKRDAYKSNDRDPDDKALWMQEMNFVQTATK